MALDLDKLFAQGGKKLVALLQHAVRAAQTDLLFVFLVEEYRQTPTAAKAVALYRSFCSADAPARLSDSTLLPPMNPFLAATLRPVEVSLQPVAGDSQSRAGQPPLLPSKLLFDSVARQIRATSAGMRMLRRDYRIRKTPLQNLPGGKMTASQRFFVDRVWQPLLKPWLVAAGFWRIAAIN